jgi:glycosyltransferase involved in cell wall biosynthesis
MRLLLIAPYFNEQHRWMASAQKAAEELSKDHEVVVLTTGKSSVEDFPSGIRIYRMFDFFIPDPVNYSIVPGLLFTLLKVLRREKPDICVVNKHMFFTSFAIPILRLAGIPVITMVDTFPGINWHPRNLFVDIVMRVYAWIIGYPLLKLSQRVVLLHEGLVPMAKRMHLNFLVIHNGVDIENFIQAKPAEDILNDQNHINIAYVGRLETVKGVEDLLEAALMVLSQHPEVHLYLVGDKRRAQAMVDSYAGAQVHFLGYRQDIAGILKQMDVFALPSYAEGLPNALMEAMSLGKACVASNVGGVRVLVRNGENGLTYPPGDRQALNKCLESLVSNPSYRKELGSQAEKTIAMAFDWKVIRKEYQKLFVSLSSKSV